MSSTSGRPGGAFSCEPLAVLNCPAQQGGVAFDAADRIAVVGQQLVTLFDMSTGTTIVKLTREARVRCVALSAKGDMLVVGGFDKKVLLLDVHAGSTLTSLPGANDTVRSVRAPASLI